MVSSRRAVPRARTYLPSPDLREYPLLRGKEEVFIFAGAVIGTTSVRNKDRTSSAGLLMGLDYIRYETIPERGWANAAVISWMESSLVVEVGTKESTPAMVWGKLQGVLSIDL